MKKLSYKIHIKKYLLDNATKSHTEYKPQLYIKLNGWSPPPASAIIESHMTLLE